MSQFAINHPLSVLYSAITIFNIFLKNYWRFTRVSTRMSSSIPRQIRPSARCQVWDSV